MSLVHRCMIIPATLQDKCQEIPEASGMWTAGLSLDGSSPATHYISSGLVDQSFADLLESPVALAAEAGFTLNEAQDIVAGLLLSEDNPHEAMAHMGLSLVVGDEE